MNDDLVEYITAAEFYADLRSHAQSELEANMEASIRASLGERVLHVKGEAECQIDG